MFRTPAHRDLAYTACPSLPGEAPLSILGSRWFKAGVSVLILVLMLWWLDVDQVVVSLAGADGWLIGAAFGLVVFNRLLMPLKWALLVRARGIPLPLGLAVRSYFIASFIGFFLPPTVGMDSVRTVYLARRGYRGADVLASIVVERFVGLLVLVAFAVAGALVLENLLTGSGLGTGALLSLVVAAALLAVVGFQLSFTNAFAGAAVKILDNLVAPRSEVLAARLNRFLVAYREYRDRRGAIALFFVLTALELFVVIFRTTIIAAALGVDVALLVFLAFIPIVTFLSRLPVSFDGFGINEGLFVFFLGAFGVGAEQAFAVGLLNHLVFIGGIMLGSAFYFLDRQELPR